MSGVIDTIRRATHSRRARRGQAGFTLLEAIVGLGLVSTVIITLAGGLLTSVRSSNAANETQKIDAALSAYAEGFKATSPTFCPPAPTSTSIPGYTAEVVSVDSWNGSGWDTTCSDGSVPYRLNLTLTDSSGSSVPAQVVVGRP